MKVDFEDSKNCSLLGFITTRFIYFVQIQSRGRLLTYNSGEPDEYHVAKSCPDPKPVLGFDRVECDCKLEHCPRGLYALHVHVYDYIKSVATLKFNLERDCQEITFTTKYNREEVDPQTNPIRRVLKSFGYTEERIAKWLNGVNFEFTFDRHLTYVRFEYPEDKQRNVLYTIGIEEQGHE